MTAEQGIELALAFERLLAAALSGSSKAILEELHRDAGEAIAALPADPENLTDAAAERDQALVELLKREKFGG